MMFIQSILVPTETRIQDLKKKGFEWLSDISTSEVEKSDTEVKYVQASADVFRKDTLGLVTLSKEDKLYAVVGELLENISKEDKLSFGVIKKGDNIVPLPTPIGRATLAETAPIPIPFNSLLDGELSNFMDIMRGTLNQSGGDPSKKKNVLLTALDNFKKFLIVSLDTVEAVSKTDNTNKMEVIMTKDEVKEIVKETLSEISKEDTNKAAVLTKDDVKTIVKEALGTLQSSLPTLNASMSKSEASDDMKSGFETLTKSLNDLGTKLADVITKQDTLGQQIGADRVPVGDRQLPTKNRSVFSGLLTGRK